jgi:DNA-binding NtrC family response regulator
LEPRSLAKKHLLIVEDEPLIRSDLRGILEEAGYQVKEAGKADDAILLLEEDGITAVLTDIEMPGTLTSTSHG